VQLPLHEPYFDLTLITFMHTKIIYFIIIILIIIVMYIYITKLIA